MAVTEVKKEPIDHKDTTEYEETVLDKIIKPPVNKVNVSLCTKFIGQLLFVKHGSILYTVHPHKCSVSSGGPLHVSGVWQWKR